MADESLNVLLIKNYSLNIQQILPDIIHLKDMFFFYRHGLQDMIEVTTKDIIRGLTDYSVDQVSIMDRVMLDIEVYESSVEHDDRLSSANFMHDVEVAVGIVEDIINKHLDVVIPKTKCHVQHYKWRDFDLSIDLAIEN